MAGKFIYLSSVVTYRVPILDNGKLGTPEVLKKFTTETYAPKKKPTKKPSEQETVSFGDLTEEEAIDWL